MSEKHPTARAGARRLRRGLAAIAGLAVGLAVTEAAFHARDGGAFPHLNVYAPDDALGVRLRPGAVERVQFGGGPVTSVRINAQGYRGADWPPPGGDEIVVVGDSQVFGLGVEEGETFGAQLGEILGARVLDAGVPTYGPIEYGLVIEEILKTRRPRAVIWVANLYNDLFEAVRPNARRHRVWDGWAVRVETAPERVTSFPGRELLFRRSHAFYALRRFLYARGPQPSDLGFPSEGTWQEILGAAGALERERRGAEALNRRLGELHEAEVDHAADALLAAAVHVERLAYDHLPTNETSVEPNIDLATARGTPGDIVAYGSDGEFDRPAPLSAAHVRAAARVRARVEEKLRQKARSMAGSPLGEDIARTLDQEKVFAERLAALRAAPAEVARALSPFAPHVEKVKALCDAAGASLLVVALPMDVQVSAEEWTKYGQAPLDMKEARVIATDTVELAEALGAKGLDPTEALARAEPGAFLPRDLHLTPKGHRALAEAVAARLRAETPRKPRGGLPKGRSRVPRASEWATVAETSVRGSTSRGCETKRIREWFGFFCSDRGDVQDGPLTVDLVEGGHDEVVSALWTGPVFKVDRAHGKVVPTGEKRHYRVFVAPVLPGERLVADFTWAKKKSRLVSDLPPDDGDPSIAFHGFEDHPPIPAPEETEAARELCAIHLGHPENEEAWCSSLAAQPDEDCRRTYASDPPSLLACASGDPVHPPSCREGFVNAGALARCMPSCGPGLPCKEGACVDWQGGGVCMRSAPRAPAELPPPAPRIEVDAPPSDALLARAREVVRRAQACAAGCELVHAGPHEFVYTDIFDACRIPPPTAEAALAAVRALDEHLRAAPAERRGTASLFAEDASLFAEWLELTQRTGRARGLLARFATMIEVWNGWRPAEAVPVYDEALLAQYRSSIRTRDLAKKNPIPVWRRCRTGACL